jgi:hypothetical protein
MNAALKKWVIILIAFDDPELAPQVIKECIADGEDEKLMAFLRGGEVLDVICEEDEAVAEQYRRRIERECLR